MRANPITGLEQLAAGGDLVGRILCLLLGRDEQLLDLLELALVDEVHQRGQVFLQTPVLVLDALHRFLELLLQQAPAVLVLVHSMLTDVCLLDVPDALVDLLGQLRRIVWFADGVLGRVVVGQLWQRLLALLAFA